MITVIGGVLGLGAVNALSMQVGKTYIYSATAAGAILLFINGMLIVRFRQWSPATHYMQQAISELDLDEHMLLLLSKLKAGKFRLLPQRLQKPGACKFFVRDRNGNPSVYTFESIELAEEGFGKLGLQNGFTNYLETPSLPAQHYHTSEPFTNGKRKYLLEIQGAGYQFSSSEERENYILTKLSSYSNATYIKPYMNEICELLDQDSYESIDLSFLGKKKYYIVRRAGDNIYARRFINEQARQIFLDNPIELEKWQASPQT